MILAYQDSEPRGTVIHSFSIPLGDARWLQADYIKEESGYKWSFSNGGRMMPHEWPEVIARGICGLPRFGNHLKKPYTVGQHSFDLWVYLKSRGASVGALLLSLVHDAPEALGVGDLNSHLKRAIGGAISRYEDELTDFILGETGVIKLVTDEDRALVHATDKVFGAGEARLFNMRNADHWKVAPDNETFVWMQHHIQPRGDDPRVLQWWHEAWNQTMAHVLP